jgi:predicted Zn-dependent protease
MALRANLELLLARGQDSPLLRFSLGGECLKERDFVAAIEHLREAIRLNRNYSAAWKLLGQAYAGAGSHERAAAVYAEGIEVAVARGDVQAAKEMQVFLRRLHRTRSPDGAE